MGSSLSYRAPRLQEMLERYDLSDLGDKFMKARVTANILFELSEVELIEYVQLNIIELRRYFKAQETFKGTESQNATQKDTKKTAVMQGA